MMILKFEKWVKYMYANEMTYDIIHSTQYYIEYINRALLANLQCKTLKLGRLGLGNTPMTVKNYVPMATHSFLVPTHFVSICW